ncbi:MAG: DNA translocase FtsK, partial [Thermoanaerobacteraceae bacterium]|nr:DNA translocase FtsK [Thermoanaerobacteraceae bacterium]
EEVPLEIASYEEMPEEDDELLPQAVEVLLRAGHASISLLQRRLKIGYARAARLIDIMERRGIVGPFEGSKPRALLMTLEQYHATFDRRK